ncbi:hypothetical protein BIV57_04225 [Mangrovactinospora gilvigrisea]|uniref:Uncharacterized protein n=1 Tax=Mangrovactinospora gilvigrisea TaxID=1428644 RepID=A0A1J7BJ88_9ACTN|nr:hypothetical protein [Mangrovactinospora gilvigrisea]OIV38702.1 hypothetical protein BIV57_04225 [Mangrovactinospora gilvigrisea]
MPANAIILTGPSGVGKSTIGRRLQQVLPGPWLLYEVDQCSPPIPPGSLTEQQIVAANIGAARAWADTGIPVIVEIALLGEEDLQIARSGLHGHHVFVVVLDCTRIVLEAHLAARGVAGPPPSHALPFYQRTAGRWPTGADLQLCVDGLTPDQAAARIAQAALPSGGTTSSARP